MDKNIELKAKLFRGLGDSLRLQILELLIDKPLCVSDLVNLTSMTQPKVSNHLKCLKECGLVVTERKGKFIHYSLTNSEIRKLLQQGNSVLSSVEEYIEDCENYNIN